MLKARSYTFTGESGDAFELPEDLFDGVVHEAALYQVVKAYLANQRQGNASTKTRGQVSGGGRKIWRQKGTGRARQGSIRAGHWTGGGVIFGPMPRSYRQDIPKKVRQLARRSALNTRALEDQVVVIDSFDLDEPRTRAIRDLLEKIEVTGSVLVLTDGPREVVHLSGRNLPNVTVLPFEQASTYDILRAKFLIIEKAALEQTDQAETPQEEETTDA